MTSQLGKLVFAIHILSNISRSKGNQTTNFGQLKKYVTWKTIFLTNHRENVVEKLFPDPSLRNPIEHIFGSIA